MLLLQWDVWQTEPGGRPNACGCISGQAYLAGYIRACEEKMTNRIALILALIISAALLIDVIFYGTEHLLFLGKKLFEFLEWLAFWR